MSTAPRPERRAWGVLAALSLLYAAQGVPFGFAAEYLPVVLREQGLSRTAIAAFGWLQLPWQLKFLWASVGDHPAVRPRAGRALLALQFTLAAVMGSYALVGAAHHLAPWAALTLVAALLAATQDVFVDAFAVRALSGDDRGWGNAAQIAGYRLGMIVGGGGMLALSGLAGQRASLVACGSLIALAGVGAFAFRTDGAPAELPGPYREPSAVTETPPPARGAMRAMLTHLTATAARPVALVALTYKLGLHAAAALIKPMLVDAGWSREHIGALAVSLGAAAAVLGSVAGGALHRWVGERRALQVGVALQGAAVLPLVAAAAMGCPKGLTTFAIGAEHFASGAGTTVLFAALMTATRRSRAALHYTVLTSLNALAIGLGGVLGSVLGDLAGPVLTYSLAAVLCALPLPWLARWESHATASAAESETQHG